MKNKNSYNYQIYQSSKQYYFNSHKKLESLSLKKFCNFKIKKSYLKKRTKCHFVSDLDDSFNIIDWINLDKRSHLSFQGKNFLNFKKLNF